MASLVPTFRRIKVIKNKIHKWKSETLCESPHERWRKKAEEIRKI